MSPLEIKATGSSKSKARSSNKPVKPKVQRAFDLEERTARFGEDVVRFTRTVTGDNISLPLISQLVRSATSIGANYLEADGAESGRDFVHKISIAKKEAKETGHWLRTLAAACPALRKECQELWREAHELTLILSSIVLKHRKEHLS